jgi:hypothetical protein
MTVLMGVGIAIYQPALPSLVSVWLPTRVGPATAVYVNGLLVGETLSAGLTLPVILPLVRGRWTRSLAVWALPILLTFGVPLVGGAVWDRTHVPATAFLPVALGALTMLVAAAGLPARGRL